MNVAVSITPTGQIDPRWGRADVVAVASVSGSDLNEWQEYDVRWSTLHDGGTEGSHHARVARFLREHAVRVVVVEHLGAGMQRMLDSMGIQVVTGASGDARQAAVAPAFGIVRPDHD